MDTNTIMLIALAIIVVLSALAIWMANRGSGVEDPPHETDSIDSDDPVVEHDTVASSKPKVVDSKPAASVKSTDNKAASDVKVVDKKTSLDDKSDIKVVDNSKKTSTTNSPADSRDNVSKVSDAKNPPKKR